MESYNPKFVPTPSGFTNTGAICWLNALIQSLLSCSVFNKTILENKDDLQKTDLGRLLFLLVRDSLMEKSTNHYTGAIRNVLTSQKNFGFGQECAEEGFHFLIDALNSNPVSYALTHRFRCSTVCFECKRVFSEGEDVNFTVKMFHYDGMNAFLDELKYQVSDIDGRCTCGSEIKRIYRLTMLPEIVIVVFNKFKHKKLITFPQRFELDSLGGEKMIFKQVAQIEHSGNMNGGHYWAHCLRQGSVYCMNDSSCTRGSFNPTPNTYMVFYNYSS